MVSTTRVSTDIIILPSPRPGGLHQLYFILFYLLVFIYLFIFIWLHQVLVEARGIFVEACGIFFLVAACGLLSCGTHVGSSSPTRNQTRAPCTGSQES